MPEVGETRSVRLGDGVAMIFCWIPPGRFRMGSRDVWTGEQLVHEVEITQGFWLGQTPVTQRQYAAFDPAHKNGFPGKPGHPVEQVDWHRAVAFCDALTQRLDVREWAGWAAGLPSEAQWEYACRAGTASEYHTGDGEVALRRAGWFDDNANGTMHPVGQREANGFGLYDMHGNVWEWCRDAWDEHAYRRRAERAPETGDMEASASDPARVVRGGAWYYSAGGCRAAYRFGIPPGVRYHIRGFRVAVFPSPSCPDKSGASEGSERAARRRAGSARAPGGAGAAMGHDNGDTMNEIALSSLDGQQWHDAEDKPGEQDIVTRVVIGTLDAEEPTPISDALWQQVLAHWPSITHLHLWSITDLTELPELPAKLECLDLRHCQQLESLPALPDSLVTLDLARCTALKQLPAGATPALRFLHLDGCTGLRASAINGKVGACPKLEELTLTGCTQLHELEEPASSDDPPLRKLVLKGCTKLHTLPDLSSFGRLNHLNLNGCAALAALPPLPILEDPDPPRAWHEPVRGLRYLVTQGCENLRDYRGLDLRPVHLSADADDNVIDTLRALHWLGQPPAELLSSKLLLLGSGRVGKTTLAKALQWADLDAQARTSERGQALDPCKGSASTHGIQFWPWAVEFALPHGGGQRRGRVHIWDFAGQEIYHNTHRLFAASGAVFVIVCCDRHTHTARLQRDIDQQGLNGAEREAFERENEYREVRYWLDYVRAALGLKEDAAERLPVILVHSGAKGSKTDYLLQQAGPYRAAIEARTLPVLAVDCASEAFLDDADFKGLRAELARRLGASADQLGIRVPAFYRDVHATVEALLNGGRPRSEQAVFTFAQWRDHLIDTLGQPSAATDAFPGVRGMGDGGTTAGSVVSGAAPTPTLPRARGRESDMAAPYPALAFEHSVLHAVTRHLHRIGQVFWLDEQAEGDVIVDQALGAETIYALCTRYDKPLREHAGAFAEAELTRLLARELRADGLDTSQLLQLLAKCGVCLPIGAGRWQALNPALLPPLNPAIRATIGGQWFELLGQAPGYVNHSFRLSGDGGMQIGAADMQATMAWLLRYGLHDGDEGQRLPRWLALGGDANADGPGKAEGERGPAIRWHPQYHFWRAGAQVLWTPAFDREHRWREDARAPAPGESPSDPFLLRIQYVPFDLKDARGERTLAYAGSLYLELLSRDEAGMAPRLRDALLGEGGPLAFFRDHYQIDDQRPDDLPAERIGHPRDDRMLPWQRTRNPAEPRMRHDVAISVRGSDVDVAEPLYRALHRAGLEAYYYRDDARGKLHGEQRESGLVEIYDYLDQATCLILIGSNRYFDLHDATLHGGNIYCPVELAAAVASLQRDVLPRKAGQIFVLAVSREGDTFDWHAFDSKVTNTLQEFGAIVTERGKPHSRMQRKERDWVEAASDGISRFVDDGGSQAKQAVRWDGRAETRDAAIADLVRRVRAALKAGD